MSAAARIDRETTEHLAALTVAPYIPELHADDCDDAQCLACKGLAAASLPSVDVPPPVLIARVEATTARKRALIAAGVAAEARHLYDPSDTAFAALPCPHPELCSTEADYPEWAAELAEQIRISDNTRRTR